MTESDVTTHRLNARVVSIRSLTFSAFTVVGDAPNSAASPVSVVVAAGNPLMSKWDCSSLIRYVTVTPSELLCAMTAACNKTAMSVPLVPAAGSVCEGVCVRGISVSDRECRKLRSSAV